MGLWQLSTRASAHVIRFKPTLLLPRCHLVTSTAATKWKILFFGSDDFSLPHLKTLWQNKQNGHLVEHLSVVTTKENKDIQHYTHEKKLSCHFWPVLPDLLKTLNFDLGVLVSFGQKIPADIISAFPKGVINIHPSLLPRWQGAAPLLHTILGGDKTTGVSVMRIQPHRFDQGPVIYQSSCDLDIETTSAELRVKMADEGSRALTTVLSDLDRYLAAGKDQDLSRATAAPKLNVGHANINWNDTVEQIARQYRTLGSVFQLRSQFNGLNCKLLDMERVSDTRDLWSAIQPFYPGREFTPGEQCFVRKRELLCIKCQDGWVAFKNIIVKKPVTARGFYNGYLSNNQDLRFDSLEHGLEQFNHWNSPFINTV